MRRHDSKTILKSNCSVKSFYKKSIGNFNFFVLCTLSFCMIFFASCQNFLTGASLKDDLNKAIKYASEDAFTIKILPENPEMGSVQGNSERKVKTEDELELFFETSSSYNFSKWIVIVNGKIDEDSEYIHIYEPKNKNTKIKVIKSAENILIRPVCYEFLKTQTVYPEWGYVSTKDTAIEAHFNSNVDIMSFRFTMDELEELNLLEDGQPASFVQLFKDSKGLIYAYKTYDNDDTMTYKNIEITCDDKNMAMYYGIPRVQNNVLTIPVDYNNLIPLTESETKNITVTINKNVVSNMGVSMLSNKEWKFRIGSNTYIEQDKEPPVIDYIMAAKTSDDFASSKLFTTKPFNEFIHTEAAGQSDYLTNCIQDSFVIKIEASDLQTGIKGIFITEKLIYDRDGIDKTTDSSEYTSEYTDKDFVISEDGFSATFETEYKIKTLNDGCIQIKVKALDNNNNLSEKLLYVITDRKAYLDKCKLYNNQTYTRNFTLEIPKETVYKDITSDLTFSIYCGDDPLNITTPLNSCLTKKADTTYSFTYNESVYPSAFTKHTYIKVIAEDRLGNVDSFIQIVPRDVRAVYKDSSSAGGGNWGTSDAYENWNYYSCMDSTYGITFERRQWSNNKTEIGAYCRKRITYEADYTKQIQYDAYFYDYTSCYYESAHGKIYSSSENVKIARGNGSLPLDLIDENGNPVTFEVTKEGQDSGFYIFKVKVSGKVRSMDGKTQYASYMLKKKEQYCVYFEGTEATFLVPVSENIKTNDFSIVALDSCHMSSPGSSENTQKTGVSSFYWNLDRTGTEGVIRNVDYNLCCDNDYTRYKNEDYTSDYIKIISPNKNTDPSVSLNPEATVYYKKIGQDILGFLKDKTVYSGGSTYQCYVLNPNALIDYEMLTYEQIEQFDSMTVYEQGTTKEDKGFFIPIFNLQDGDYIFFVKIKDSAGNTNYGSFHYNKSRSNYALNKDTVTISANTITIKTIVDPHRMYRRFRMDYINNGTWSKACEAEVYKDRNDINLNSIPSVSTSFTKSSSWMKIYCHESEYDGAKSLFGENVHNGNSDYFANTNKYFYHAPVYVYPNGSIEPPYTSSNVGVKNIFEGKALSILCSQPALAQTFQSPVNFGENTEDWEYYTSRDWCLNPVEIPAGGGNYEIPVDQIKPGYYYCMIVRFSDGSTMISTIKQKTK